MEEICMKFRFLVLIIGWMGKVFIEIGDIGRVIGLGIGGEKRSLFWI